MSTTAKTEVIGRFTLDEINDYAEMRNNVSESQWVLFVKTLADEELAAIENKVNEIGNERMLSNIEEFFKTDYSYESAVEFLATVPMFATLFVDLFKSATVPVQGRGDNTKTKSGRVLYNSKGDARVADVPIPVNGGTLMVRFEH